MGEIFANDEECDLGEFGEPPQGAALAHLNPEKLSFPARSQTIYRSH